MIKLKLSEIVGVRDWLRQLIEIGMTPQASVVMALNVMELDKLYKAWDEAQRKLYKKHGVERKDDQGREVVVLETDEAKAAFTKDRTEALSMEHLINITQISKYDLLPDEKHPLKPMYFLAMPWLFHDLNPAQDIEIDTDGFDLRGDDVRDADQKE